MSDQIYKKQVGGNHYKSIDRDYPEKEQKNQPQQKDTSWGLIVK